MGKIVFKTPDHPVKDKQGMNIHIPEELWELTKKHTIMVEDDVNGERYLLVDLTEEMVREKK
jgi:hypothetical protein